MKGRSPSLPRIYTQQVSLLFFSQLSRFFFVVSFGYYCHIEDKVGICTRRARHTCIAVPYLRAHRMDANNGQWNSLPRERHFFKKKVASVVGSMTNLISLISQSACSPSMLGPRELGGGSYLAYMWSKMPGIQYHDGPISNSYPSAVVNTCARPPTSACFS